MPNLLASFPDELECDTLVIRGIFGNCIENNEITSLAFKRRFLHYLRGYEEGLSVAPSVAILREKVDADKFVTLHVGKVRDLGLQVEQTDAEHGRITGMPTDQEDPKTAEDLATELLMQAKELNPPNQT